MNSPTFYLEGVIKDKNEMQDFEGPLNLILMLLSKNKIEIRDIQISAILDQYIDYIAQMQEMDLEVASEFVQMASHLLYIKTKTLLASEEEVSELDLLITSLEQLKCRESYTMIKAVTDRLGGLYEVGALLWVKQPEHISVNREYEYKHEGVDLLRALASVFSRGSTSLEPIETDTLMPRPIVYEVREKSRQLIERLRSSGPVSLRELYRLSGSRSEVVATFISVLELCSSGNIALGSENGEIILSFKGEGDTETILSSLSAEIDE